MAKPYDSYLQALKIRVVVMPTFQSLHGGTGDVIMKMSGTVTLKLVSGHDANFFLIGGTGGCRYDNQQYHQSWHHGDSWLFSRDASTSIDLGSVSLRVSMSWGEPLKYREISQVILNGHLARYVNLRVAHVPEMPGTFSPPPRVSDPDMHHVTRMTHVRWCRDR